MLGSMQYAGFTQFHADFTESSMQNAMRNRNGILAESIRNLSMPYPCLVLRSMQISRYIQADFTQSSMQNALRNPSGMVAELFRNRSGILAESI